MGVDCKSTGSAYAGSNPARPKKEKRFQGLPLIDLGPVLVLVLLPKNELFISDPPKLCFGGIKLILVFNKARQTRFFYKIQLLVLEL
jgi:hypothetical protein